MGLEQELEQELRVEARKTKSLLYNSKFICMYSNQSEGLTWLGGVDAGGADHLGRGGAKRDLNGALLSGRELLRGRLLVLLSGRELLHGGLLVLLRNWLVVLRGRGLWSLMHGRRLTILAGEGRNKVDSSLLPS